ncbi:MAG: LPS export ABC transporter periplasmic protein LptC [Hyphomicrobiaceae bacterium]|nr:LPS export ABC transporter periplasmic protein LptC [Hyphomicrobiaceae bacterium]
MAIALDTAIPKRRASTRERHLAGGYDRSKAFRSARRHTMLVRLLRVTLPICAVCCLAVFFLSMKRTVKVKGGTITVSSVSLTGDGLKMQKPKYEGYSKDGARYVVEARTALPEAGKPDRIHLDDIDGTLTQANGQRMRLKSKKGLFDNKKNELELFEGIDIRGENGMMARLTRATVFVKEQRIISNEPIYAELINGWIRAQRVEILQKSRLMTFEGNVKVHLKKLPAQPKTAPAGKTAPAQPATPESRPQ